MYNGPIDVSAGRLITPAQWAEIRRADMAGADETGEATEILLRYQRRLLETTALNQITVVEKSRRTGMTWAAAADAVMTSAASRAAGGMNTLYMGYNLDMAREFIDTCAMWCESFGQAASASGVQAFEFDDDGVAIQAFRITFPSGYEIVALPSKPRSLRGRQGYLILDEAAFNEFLEEVMNAAVPFLMWGGKILVISTHFGESNPFNELIQDARGGRKPYAVLRVTLDEALRDGLFVRICRRAGTEWTPEAEAAWRQKLIAAAGDVAADEEFFCIPSQGSGAWLPGPLIESRMVPDIPILRWELPADFLQLPELVQRGMVAAFMADLERVLSKLDRTRRHALGYDFGRVRDLSVLWLFALSPTMRRETALVIEMRRIPHTEQIAVAEAVIRAMPRRCGAAFDATGEGNVVAEAMQRRFGAANPAGGPGGLVASIKLTTEWYRTEMPPLKVAFEDGSITVPKDDDTFGDLRLVQVIRGVPQVPAIRTGSGDKKRHGDAAVAVALAYYASRMAAVADVEVGQIDRDDGVADALEGYGFDRLDVRLDDYVRM